jgi:AcrR family transcriptional regulator
MSEKKLDRRVKRTRRMLRQALLELIIEQGYDNLTITELTERADLRRATFYLHYSDIDELLLAVLQHLFDKLIHDLEAQRPMPVFYRQATPPHALAMLEYLDDNATLYRALLDGKCGVLVQRYIRDYLARIKRAQLEQLPPDSLPQPVDVLANYVAGAEMSMLVWWLENDRPYPAADLAEMMQSLLLQGLQPLTEATS